MQAGRQHQVPLSGRALEILDVARTLGDGGSPIVFVSERGTLLDDKRLRRLLEKHKIAAVPHGFRSSFRDWAAEETNHPREVVEAALAHVVGNKVEAAYARSDLFERRRTLTEQWAAWRVKVFEGRDQFRDRLEVPNPEQLFLRCLDKAYLSVELL